MPSTKRLLMVLGEPTSREEGVLHKYGYNYAGVSTTWRQVVRMAKEMGLKISKGGNGQSGTMYTFNRGMVDEVDMHVYWTAKEFFICTDIKF